MHVVEDFNRSYPLKYSLYLFNKERYSGKQKLDNILIELGKNGHSSLIVIVQT